MRKGRSGLGISLDGYIARPDGAVDFSSCPRTFDGPVLRHGDEAIMAGRPMRWDDEGWAAARSQVEDAMYVFSHSHAQENAAASPSSTNPENFVEKLRKPLWKKHSG